MHVKTTRELLADSFRELAANRPISKISVTSIAENCGMTPPTFYNHFTDKYDLIAWIYGNDVEALLRRCREDSQGRQAALTEWILYYSKNRDFILNMIKNTKENDSFIRQMARTHTDTLCNLIRRKSMKEKLSEDAVNLVKIYCYGTLGFICEWLLGGMPIPTEKMVRLLEDCMPAALRECLDAGGKS